MSDVEDGELVSSDDDHLCSVTEDNGQKTKLINDKNNNFATSDNNQWNFEQNNVKVNEANTTTEFKEESNRSKTNQSSIDPDRKGGHTSRKHIERKRKLTPENFDSDSYQDHKFIKQNILPQTKRKILCKYYAAGDCKNGSTCAFMHEEFPCKFFHDESTTCRAGINCKYSHADLTGEMKIVLDGFIQEGKEKAMLTYAIPTFKNESFITSNSPTSPTPQPRPNFLLPTPVMDTTQSNSNYDPDFSEAYQDILNYPSYKYTYNTIPNYPIANKSQFVQSYPKPGTPDFERQRSKFISRNIPNIPNTIQFNSSFSTQNTHQSLFNNIEYLEELPIYDQSNNCHYQQSFTSNGDNIVPNAFDEASAIQTKELNYRIHAPARFIVGNQLTIKTEPQQEIVSDFDYDFKDALKRLAEQIVTDPVKQSHSFDKSTFDEDIEKVSKGYVMCEVDTSNIRKNVNKNETSIVKNEAMSECEKMYIEEMKSLINLNAQFENVIAWEAIKLDPVQKQPYVLFELKLDEIHDNPLADPRLNGHPVLNFLVKREDELPTFGNDEDYPALSRIKVEKVNKEQFDESKPYLCSSKLRKRKIV